MIIKTQTILNALYFLFLVSLTACSGGGDTSKKERQSKSRTEESEQTPSTASNAPITIRQVNLYLETSASMNGYLNGATEFKETLANLVGQLDKLQQDNLITKTSFSLIPRDTVIEKLADADEFLNLLKTPKVAIGANTHIVDIFTMLQSRNAPQSVNIFISDCILSDFDITNKSIIQGQVNRVFNKYESAGTATSIYAFTSDYTGKYYPYPKGVQNYKDIERPYYIWIFGNSQKVDALNRALKKADFAPKEELHFGFEFESTPTFSIMNYAGKKGEYVVAKNNQALEDVELYKGKTLELGLGINLSAFPDKLTTNRYLTSNLVLEGENVEGEVVAVQALDEAQLTKSDNTLAEKNELTHIITVQISSIKGKQGSFDLALTKKDTPWYKQWSIDDDTDLEQNEGKTFALAYLISGVKQAYKDDSDYFKITVPLVKE